MKKITFLVAFFLAIVFQGYSQFSEGFESGIPSNWSVINNGDPNTWEVTNSEPHFGSNGVRIYYSAESHDDYLVTQQFTVNEGISDRLSLWAKNLYNSYPEPFDILVSTTGNNAEDFTNTLASQVSPLDYGWQKFVYSLDAYLGQTIYIAFHSTTTNMYELYLDDVTVDSDPTTPPACVTNSTAVINSTCGNFSTTISWDNSEGADGYYLTVGTTPTGGELFNNQNMGPNNSFTIYQQNPNTTYYWKAVPYNNIGAAIGCITNEYTTATNGCFCYPNPISVDNLGLTNVSIGTINNNTETEEGNYGDYTHLSTDIYRGLYTPFSLTYETGFTYETKIWVDWNNDYDFDDAGEEVYSGSSDSSMPTALTGLFMVPANASLGQHRMRIGGQDNGPVTPCYTGDYGSFEDYTVNVIVPSCIPAEATTSITYDCSTSQYFVQVNVTNLGNGSPSVTDGVSTWPITAIGNVQIGPFSFGNSVSLTLQHGIQAMCSIPLGSFNYLACAPANDDCGIAIPLTLGATYEDNIVEGTNLAATTSSDQADTCSAYNGGDIWYSVVVPASGNVTVETGHLLSGETPYFDSIITVYSGECGELVYLGCDDDGAGIDNYSRVTVTGQTPGSILKVRVYEYFNDHTENFGISAYDESLLNTNSFTNASLAVYPNPAKDVLNLSYTSSISKISIINILGQEVLKKDINAKQSQIDISNLSNGTYIVKVAIDNTIETVKIIKSN